MAQRELGLREHVSAKEASGGGSRTRRLALVCRLEAAAAAHGLGASASSGARMRRCRLGSVGRAGCAEEQPRQGTGASPAKARGCGMGGVGGRPDGAWAAGCLGKADRDSSLRRSCARAPACMAAGSARGQRAGAGTWGGARESSARDADAGAGCMVRALGALENGRAYDTPQHLEKDRPRLSHCPC